MDPNQPGPSGCGCASDSPSARATAAYNNLQELGDMRRQVGVETRRRNLGGNLPDIFFAPNAGVETTRMKAEYLTSQFREAADNLTNVLNVTPPRRGIRPNQPKTPEIDYMRHDPFLVNTHVHLTTTPPRPFGGVPFIPGQVRNNRQPIEKDFLQDVVLPDDLMYPVDFVDQGPEPLDLLQMSDPGNLSPAMIPAPQARNWLQGFDDRMELQTNLIGMIQRSRAPLGVDMLREEDMSLDSSIGSLRSIEEQVQREAERLIAGLALPQGSLGDPRRRRSFERPPRTAGGPRRGSAPGQLRTEYPSFRSSFGREWPDVPPDMMDMHDISMGSMASSIASSAPGSPQAPAPMSPKRDFGDVWPDVPLDVDNLLDMSIDLVGDMLDSSAVSRRRSFGGGPTCVFPAPAGRPSAPGALLTGPASRFPPREEPGVLVACGAGGQGAPGRVLVGQVFQYPARSGIPAPSGIRAPSARYSPVPGPSNRSPPYRSPSPAMAPGPTSPLYDPEEDFDLEQPSPRRFRNIQYEEAEPGYRPRRLRGPQMVPRVLDFDAPECQATPKKPPPAPRKPQRRIQYEALVPMRLDFDNMPGPQTALRRLREQAEQQAARRAERQLAAEQAAQQAAQQAARPRRKISQLPQRRQR